ncbi:MAG: UDP-3-O-acyl-N-acetylglucosamine deacetylase [Planctomycetota bacterium]|nr:MAG: UDP-3-O-acyl-N-acetylglucosamine deacetylase [Planctomycetota bacterium]
MTARRQRTLARPVIIEGFGLFGGADVTMTLLPAPADTGLLFERVDLPGRPQIPARIHCLVPQPRRTILARGTARVEMVEHVLAALAGLWVDNCRIQLDALEPPVGDGSALEIVEAILCGEITLQASEVRPARVTTPFRVDQPGERGAIDVSPGEGCTIQYDLDYGATVIPAQSFTALITPEEFVREIAFARTFVLESEVALLRARGFGQRATPQNLLVFGPGGVVDNVLRAPDECARHKLLDCIGDFALAGGLPRGRFHAVQSGHHLNHRVIQGLLGALEPQLQSA